MINTKKAVYTLSVLIILDVVTTMICIMVGGIEYNPVSLFFINESYFLFILIKIVLLTGIYILNNYTNIFENKLNKILMFFVILIFTYVVLLNILYITLKLTGMI